MLVCGPMVFERLVRRMDTSRVFRLLANEERRLIVKGLLEEDERLSMDALARYVVVQTRDDDGGVSEEEHRTAKVDLYHRHLPMLADHGIVDYDPRNGMVTAAETESVESYLEDVSQLPLSGG